MYGPRSKAANGRLTAKKLQNRVSRAEDSERVLFSVLIVFLRYNLNHFNRDDLELALLLAHQLHRVIGNYRAGSANSTRTIFSTSSAKYGGSSSC